MALPLATEVFKTGRINDIKTGLNQTSHMCTLEFEAGFTQTQTLRFRRVNDVINLPVTHEKIEHCSSQILLPIKNQRQ